MGASSSAMARPMPREAPVISAAGRKSVEVMGEILGARELSRRSGGSAGVHVTGAAQKLPPSAEAPGLAGWKADSETVHPREELS
ncbi:hypothetical protein GCM10027404_17310 [Arthrobacter tumbae]